MPEPLLRIENLEVSYGAIAALRGVSLQLQEGEMVALIGGNGAGKSTLLNAIFGEPPAKAGKIIFAGEDITHLPTEALAARGLALVPEGRRIFARMSVLENLQLGGLALRRQEMAQELEKIYTLFPRLKERQKQRAGTLSGGEQQMLAIGRGLMMRPRCLLLDEPSLGLAPILVQQIFQALRVLNAGGLSIFLVEQNAHQALALAHMAYVLVTGQITLTGSGKELRQSAEVQAAYLGKV